MGMDIKNLTQPSALNSQSSAASARKVAEEFASLLLLEMLKSMRATLSGEGLDGEKSSSRDSYVALADVEVTRVLAKRDGVGLTDFLEQSLHRMEQRGDAQAISPAAGEEEGL
ncbi:MAG: hypothetical protein AB7P69_07380 [Candidatus Binatia bacterium]